MRERENIEDKINTLGFVRGSICEVILTTINPDGSRNAAPMGIMRTGPISVEIKPFKTSNTYRNLLMNKIACLNITADPVLFLITSFKGECFKDFPDISFRKGMRIDDSDAHVFIEVESSQDIAVNRSRFICRATSIEVNKTTPIVFSRGKAEAIEAIVHATRIEVFSRNETWDKVENLIRRFHASKDIVEKVSAPDSMETKVVRELDRLIKGWRDTGSR
jgi:hypothetical protein